MTVQALIDLLSQCDKSLVVVGYNQDTEDDFEVSDVLLSSTDGFGLENIYNQGSSCTEGWEPQQVVVVC